MAKRTVKNNWRIHPKTQRTDDGVALVFRNGNKSARFQYKLVFIPWKGALTFAYGKTLDGHGTVKEFTRKRTKALLEKYRPFKKYV